MHSEEFLNKATAYISEPERAAEVRKELVGHLDEAVAEAVAQGLNSETAERVAVARMGAPESLALDLAEAHHKHLPWRIYLAPIPIVCLLAMLAIWHTPADYWRIGRWWLALLLFCLAPTKPTIEKVARLLQVDARAKWNWAQRQPLTSAFLLGACAGGLSGLILGTLPLWEPKVAETLPSLSSLISMTTAVAPVLVAMFLRWVHKGATILTAAFSALAFPLGYLPGLLRWWQLPNDWITMAGFFAILFTLAALTIGWLAQNIQRKGWVFR